MFPAFYEISGPEQVDENPDENQNVVEACEAARPYRYNVAVLNPEQNLDDEGREHQRPGPQSQKLYQSKIEGNLLPTIRTDTGSLEGLELCKFKLKLLLHTQLGKVRYSQLALILRVESINSGGI